MASEAPTTPVMQPPPVAEHARSGGSSRDRIERSLAADNRLWSYVAYAAVAFGCIARLGRFVDNPSLWLDEAYLALNLIEKSFSGILGTLAFVQSAPPAYLLTEKSVETLLGDSELSLRSPSILASVASVLLFAYCARRLLSPPAAALAIVLFATSEPLLERAAEVKPYSVDVAVSTLLIAVTLWVLRAPPGAEVRRTAVLGVVGMSVLWFSFPAVFTLAGAIASIAIHSLAVRARRLFVLVALTSAASAVMFAAVYLTASSTVSTVSSAIFGEGTESSLGFFEVLQQSWSVLDNPGGFINGTAALAALLVCFGVVALYWKRSYSVLALLVLPPTLAVLAELADLYPLGGRFSIFFVPSIYILAASGAQAVTGWSRRPVLLGAGIAVALLTSPLALATYHVVQPPAREDMRPELRHLVREWKDGDALYVYPLSQYALAYHAICEDCDPSQDDFGWDMRVARPVTAASDDALVSVPPGFIVGSTQTLVSPTVDVPRLPRDRRVWLLFSHVLTHDGIDPEQALVAELGESRERLAVLGGEGARLYLFGPQSAD